MKKYKFVNYENRKEFKLINGNDELVIEID